MTLTRFWYNVVCGSRKYFDEPNKKYLWMKARDAGWPNWLTRWIRRLAALFVCRLKGHVIDGREWGSCGCRNFDLWCSRCFWAHWEVDIDDVPESVLDRRKEILGG